MLTIINPDRLTGYPFFYDLIVFLEANPNQTLRAIKAHFPEVAKKDHFIDQYIKAGYIERKDKRYQANIPYLKKEEEFSFDRLTFIDDQSSLYNSLKQLYFKTELSNKTNQVILEEKTDFQRESLTLSNYFYRLKHAYHLTEEQKELYQILGDVNPEYALKYMTSFLLKFNRKQKVVQKRTDIFVKAMLVLNYIKQDEDGKYELLLDFDKENLVFKK